jgi:amino acid adenylation domain-containing protein
MSGALHDRLERAARDFAHRPAVEHDGRTISYRELWDWSGDLVSGLRDRNADSKTWCVVVDRSVWSYAMFIAAIRASATFVPVHRLDASARVDHIVRGMGAREVIVEVAEAGRSSAHTRPTAADAAPVDGASELACSAEDACGLAACDLPYVMHTSGSSGVPKAVLTTESNVLAYLAQAVERFELGPGTRFSANFELTFDGCVLESLGTLTAGGTLVVPRGRENVVADSFVRERQITHWFAVPSAIRTAQRLGALAPSSMPSLRWSLFCGEPITFQDCAAWSASAPRSAVVNVYGPTETTVTIASAFAPADRSDPAFVPIGRFDPGVEVRIDQETSELHVRGPQRCAGYHDPAMNQLAFVDDAGVDPGPVERVPPSYWYRTGDKVDLNADGEYIYRGRLDRQVKVDGRRVEPGEVEAAMLRSPSVKAVVVLDVVVAGRTRLVAAVEGRQDAEREMVSELRTRIPPHMVPSRCIWFKELPLNRNGKIDTAAVRRLVV